MLLLPRLPLLCILAHAIAVKILGLDVAARGIVLVEKEGGNGFALVAGGTVKANRTGAVFWGLGIDGAWRAGSAAFAIDVDDLGKGSLDPRHSGINANEADFGLGYGQPACRVGFECVQLTEELMQNHRPLLEQRKSTARVMSFARKASVLRSSQLPGDSSRRGWDRSQCSAEF